MTSMMASMMKYNDPFDDKYDDSVDDQYDVSVDDKYGDCWWLLITSMTVDDKYDDCWWQVWWLFWWQVWWLCCLVTVQIVLWVRYDVH